MRRKRRLRPVIKRTIVVMVVAMLTFIGYSAISKVMAKEGTPLEEPTMLATLSVEKDGKVAPTQFNGKIRKVAYLTFDDGPTKYTGDLLKVLKEKDVKATFFLIGTNVDTYSSAVKQTFDEGHYVGMHSMTHDFDTLYTKGQIVNEMVELQNKIAAITGGSKPILYRCPYGTYPGLNETLRDKTVDAGLKTWDWTVDSTDWQHQDNPSAIVENVKKQLNFPREIILLHDKPGTIKALPQIIDAIKEKGYEFEVYEESKHFPFNFAKDDRI